MDKDDLERLCGRATLSMFKKGTIFIFTDYTVVDLTDDEAVQVVYETTDGSLTDSGRLLLPTRFSDECSRMVPCVAIYRGLALSRVTKRYHDLQFVHTLSELSKADCSPVKQKKTTTKTRVKCTELHCIERNDRCPGYCESCGEHMHPYSQCKCVLRQRDFCPTCDLYSCGHYCPACGTHDCLCYEQPSPYHLEEEATASASASAPDVAISQLV